MRPKPTNPRVHSDNLKRGTTLEYPHSPLRKDFAKIVSIDGAASAMDYIRQEYVDMTVDNSPLALATIAVKAVLTKTVKGEELGGGVTKVNASVITKDNVDEAEFWGNFDLEDGYWSETANIWNTYAIE